MKKKENLPSRAWKGVQRGTVSKESYDGFSALVGVWWALRRAERGRREMIDVCERVAPMDPAVAARRTGEKSSTDEARFGVPRRASTSTVSSSKRQAADGDGLFKYVVLYALTLVVRPVLPARLTLAALWGLWEVLLRLFLS